MALIEFRNRWMWAGSAMLLATGLVFFSVVPVVAQEEAPPLPEDKIVVEIDAPDQFGIRRAQFGD